MDRQNIPAELYAFAHVAFLGLLALLLMRLLWLRTCPFPPRAAQALLIVLLIGIVIELIQPLFSRSAGLRDIRQNLVGAAAVVSLYAPAGNQRQVLASFTTVLLALELAGPGIGLWDRAVA